MCTDTVLEKINPLLVHGCNMSCTNDENGNLIIYLSYNFSDIKVTINCNDNLDVYLYYKCTCLNTLKPFTIEETISKLNTLFRSNE